VIKHSFTTKGEKIMPWAIRHLSSDFTVKAKRNGWVYIYDKDGKPIIPLHEVDQEASSSDIEGVEFSISAEVGDSFEIYSGSERIHISGDRGDCHCYSDTTIGKDYSPFAIFWKRQRIATIEYIDFAIPPIDHNRITAFIWGLIFRTLP
jgi:hypothetical protein